jgi:hypothetical protein
MSGFARPVLGGAARNIPGATLGICVLAVGDCFAKLAKFALRREFSSSSSRMVRRMWPDRRRVRRLSAVSPRTCSKHLLGVAVLVTWRS